MRRLGKVLHLSKSGNLILRLETSEIPQIGDSVSDYKIQKAGIVTGILGPVRVPYVSVQPIGENPAKLLGRILYRYDAE